MRLLLLLLLLLSACSSVRPYQKAYLNDPEMALRIKAIEQYEIAVQAYREGAVGSNGGKIGGGCGCN